MGMSTDELKEMIDNTIFQNGNGQITGNGLNLVLNAIAENAGGNGGGLQTLFFTTDSGGPVDYSVGNLDPVVLESILEHNKQIFNSIMTTWVNFFNSVEFVVGSDDGYNHYGNFNFDYLLEHTKNMQFNCCVWDYDSTEIPFSIICRVVGIEDGGMESSAVVEEEEQTGNTYGNVNIILRDMDNGECYLYSDGHLKFPSIVG